VEGSGGRLPGYIARSDDDDEAAFGAFFEGRAVGFVVVVGAVGVEELGGAFAEDLETVVEDGAGGEVLSAEAGAGVVDFEEFDRLRGVVADGGFDVGGAAAGYCEKCAHSDREKVTHEVKGIRMATVGSRCAPV
jgi:hypothetical protein